MKGQTSRHIREARLQRDLRNAPTDAEHNEESDVERPLDALATALKPSPSRGGLGGDGVGPAHP
ncbi:hypothetical protein [Dokdonella sp.]|uniref:hypothetical protein n=1 Tax=Dokdonella sp. TaxID=2291710 RepID=UPI001B089603|nr:hypothetical protein [Dokdonella sp.]MBO9661686.1 hypothetical protein [Dokdonella sp.]